MEWNRLCDFGNDSFATQIKKESKRSPVNQKEKIYLFFLLEVFLAAFLAFFFAAGFLAAFFLAGITRHPPSALVRAIFLRETQLSAHYK